MEELSYVLTKYFVACVAVRFYSFTAAKSHLWLLLQLIFTSLAASISHFPTASVKFSCFSSSEIRLLCFQSLALALFSVIGVSVNIKNNFEKYSILLLFFLSKSLGGHAISHQIKPWVAFELPYLSIECACGVDGRRSGGRAVEWLPKFLGCIGNQIFLPMVLRCARELRHYRLQYCLPSKNLNGSADPCRFLFVQNFSRPVEQGLIWKPFNRFQCYL